MKVKSEGVRARGEELAGSPGLHVISEKRDEGLTLILRHCLENPRDRGAWWAAVYGSHRVRHD